MNTLDNIYSKYVGLIPFSSTEEKDTYIKNCERIVIEKIANMTNVDIDSICTRDSVAVMFSWIAIYTFQILHRDKFSSHVGAAPSDQNIINVGSERALKEHVQKFFDQESVNDKIFIDAQREVQNFRFGQELTRSVIHNFPQRVAWEHQCEVCQGEMHVLCNNCRGKGDVECHTCNGKKKVNCYSCEGSGKIKCSKCDYWGQVSCPECLYGKKNCPHCGGAGYIYHLDGKVRCNYCYGSGRTHCYRCDGTGMIRCDECEYGYKECRSCCGSGEIDCINCSSTGLVTCNSCHGDGIVTCNKCLGQGFLHKIGEVYTEIVGERIFNIPSQMKFFTENLNVDTYIPVNFYLNEDNKQIVKIFSNKAPKCIVYVCSPANENKNLWVEFIGETAVVASYENIFDVFISGNIDSISNNVKNLNVLSKKFLTDVHDLFSHFLTIPMVHNCFSKCSKSVQEKRIIQIVTQGIRKINRHFILCAFMFHIPLLTLFAAPFCIGGPVEKAFKIDNNTALILYFIMVFLQSLLIGAITLELRKKLLKKIDSSLFQWARELEPNFSGSGFIFKLIAGGFLMGAMIFGGA